MQLDDTTVLVPGASEIDWSVVLGPLTGVTAGGLVTAGVVYADTSATVAGEYAGVSGQWDLTVLDAVEDNYNDYGGDGVDDGWQVTHFGEPPNVDAGPDENPDGDPWDNLFESLTGTDPNDERDFLRFPSWITAEARPPCGFPR